MSIKEATEDMANELMPKGFKRLKDGIFYSVGRDSSKTLKFVCSPAQVKARTVDRHGQWGLLIEFYDHADTVVRINVASSMILFPVRLSKKLAELGMRIGNASLLSIFIHESEPTQIIRDTQSKTQEQLVIENIREYIIKNQNQLHKEKGGEICFTKEALQIASGITSTQAAKILEKTGLLIKNEIDCLSKKINTHMGRVRLYCVRASILE